MAPIMPPYRSPRRTSMGPLKALKIIVLIDDEEENVSARNTPNKEMQMTSSKAADTMSMVGIPLTTP